MKKISNGKAYNVTPEKHEVIRECVCQWLALALLSSFRKMRSFNRNSLLGLSLILLSLWGQTALANDLPTANKCTQLFSLPKRGESFSDYLSKDFLEKQEARWRAFSRNVPFSKKRDFKKLPQGIYQELQPGYQAILNLSTNKKLYFKRLQDLEREVYEVSWANHITKEDALEAVLSSWESRHGFKRLIKLRKEGYSLTSWRRMLRNGALFIDPVLRDKNRDYREYRKQIILNGDVAAGDFDFPHGAETHRLQWHIIMREMEANPQAFGNVNQASVLFKNLGNRSMIEKLDWRGTGSEYKSLWYELVDTTEDNFSSPELVRRYHEYWPGLGDWS